MDIENVLKRVQLLHGLDRGEAEAYRPLAQEAAARLEKSRVKPGGDSLLEAAAAALVHWQLCLLEPAGSFTAGDVHAADPDARSAAKALWRSALAGAAPYLADEGFAFRSMP
ncbi:MAG: hypothetical protein LKE53_09270 [Oscillospiraceae bacterium]|jgi:hypothetical protein|nr:hypothetical protein [Oscillospiraceae bacterium]